MSENASAATRRIIPSLPRAHLEHAELALGFVVFELESSREIRLEVEPGLLSRPDLPLYVVAVEVEFHRLVGANPERHAVAFVDGDLGWAHLAVPDGEAVRAQQEVQPAQDEYDHRDQDQASSQCASILREVSSLSSSRSRPDCSGGTPPQR